MALAFYTNNIIEKEKATHGISRNIKNMDQLTL